MDIPEVDILYVPCAEMNGELAFKDDVVTSVGIELVTFPVNKDGKVGWMEADNMFGTELDNRGEGELSISEGNGIGEDLPSDDEA